MRSKRKCKMSRYAPSAATMEKGIRRVLICMKAYPTLFMLRALLADKPMPASLVLFKDGPFRGVNRYKWAADLAGVEPKALLVFIAACNLSALLGFLTDSILGMANIAGRCLVIMYLSVALAFLYAGSTREVSLPVALAVANMARLHFATLKRVPTVKTKWQ